MKEICIKSVVIKDKKLHEEIESNLTNKRVKFNRATGIDDNDVYCEYYYNFADSDGYVDRVELPVSLSEYDEEKGESALKVVDVFGTNDFLYSLSKNSPYYLYEVCSNTYDDNGLKDTNVVFFVDGEEYSDYKEAVKQLGYKKARDYCDKGMYEQAIVEFKKIEKYNDSKIFNDMGVCYERLGNFKQAEHYYKKAKKELIACKNLIELYNNKRVSFDAESYKNACDYLIKNKNQLGYLYYSYLYQHEEYGCYDPKMAFDYLTRGVDNCDHTEKLIFEIAYLLEEGIAVEKNDTLSHCFYKTIINNGDIPVVKYNYALQCLQGRGCQKDIDKAIEYFKKAAADKYMPAIDKLIEIFEEQKSTDELMRYKRKKDMLLNPEKYTDDDELEQEYYAEQLADLLN